MKKQPTLTSQTHAHTAHTVKASLVLAPDVRAIVNAANRANTAFFAGHDMVKPMAELNAALTKAGVR